MERLVVENEEAHALAQELADRRGISVAEAVVSSLRASLRTAMSEASPQASSPPSVRIPALEELTPKQREIYDRLGALAAEAMAHKRPGATSDHRDMYDEHGLPI